MAYGIPEQLKLLNNDLTCNLQSGPVNSEALLPISPQRESLALELSQETKAKKQLISLEHSIYALLFSVWVNMLVTP